MSQYYLPEYYGGEILLLNPYCWISGARFPGAEVPVVISPGYLEVEAEGHLEEAVATWGGQVLYMSPGGYMSQPLVKLWTRCESGDL